MKKKHKIRPGSIAWWAKDIFGGILFIATFCIICICMFMITA